MKNAFLLFSLLLLATIFINALEKPNADELAVNQAVEDYVEALYLVDSNRIKQSVHPSLHKIGYYYNPKKEAYTGPHNMSYQQLVNLASTWNANGDQANEKSPKEIEILDLLDKTATAKLTAEWGVDYFHLAKMEDKWYIMNVLWQSPPKI